MAIENNKRGWTSNQVVNSMLLLALTILVGISTFRNPPPPSSGEFSITGEVDFSSVSKIPRFEYCFEHRPEGLTGSIDLEGAEEIIRNHTGEIKGISVSAEMLAGMADMKSEMGSAVAGFHIYYTQRDSRKGVVLIPVDYSSDEILIETSGEVPYIYGNYLGVRCSMS